MHTNHTPPVFTLLTGASQLQGLQGTQASDGDAEGGQGSASRAGG